MEAPSDGLLILWYFCASVNNFCYEMHFLWGGGGVGGRGGDCFVIDILVFGVFLPSAFWAAIYCIYLEK